MKRKLLSVVLATLAMITLFAVSASAYLPSYFNLAASEYKTANLALGKLSAESGTVNGTYKYFAGQTTNNSKHGVWFDAYFHNGSKFIKDTTNSILVAGYFAHCPKLRTGTKQHTQWKLVLNSEGIWLNCEASGFIWYNM